jgi:hypothetical protein
MSAFLDPAALIRIKSLELRAKVVVEGLWKGMHRSPYHGFSVEFSEYRGHLRRIITELERPAKAAGTSLDLSVGQLADLLRKRGMICLITDLLAPVEHLEKQLALLLLALPLRAQSFINRTLDRGDGQGWRMLTFAPPPATPTPRPSPPASRSGNTAPSTAWTTPKSASGAKRSAWRWVANVNGTNTSSRRSGKFLSGPPF